MLKGNWELKANSSFGLYKMWHELKLGAEFEITKYN